jgi:hypothetical protein
VAITRSVGDTTGFVAIAFGVPQPGRTWQLHLGCPNQDECDSSLHIWDWIIRSVGGITGFVAIAFGVPQPGRTWQLHLGFPNRDERGNCIWGSPTRTNAIRPYTPFGLNKTPPYKTPPDRYPPAQCGRSAINRWMTADPSQGLANQRTQLGEATSRADRTDRAGH